MSLVLKSNSLYAGDVNNLPHLMLPRPSRATAYADHINRKYIGLVSKTLTVQDIYTFSRPASRYVEGQAGLELIGNNASPYALDPATLQALGLQLSPTRTNYIEQPISFEGANYTAEGLNSITANSDVNALTALTATSANSKHEIRLQQATALSHATNISTLQCVVKPINNGRYFQLFFYTGDGNTSYANFDLKEGRVTYVGMGIIEAFIIPNRNNSYLVGVKVGAQATTRYQARFSIINSPTAGLNTVFAGNNETISIGRVQCYYGLREGYHPLAYTSGSTTHTQTGDSLNRVMPDNFIWYTEMQLPENIKNFNAEQYLFALESTATSYTGIAVGFAQYLQQTTADSGNPIMQKFEAGTLTATEQVNVLLPPVPSQKIKMLIAKQGTTLKILSNLTDAIESHSVPADLTRLRFGARSYSGSVPAACHGLYLQKDIFYDNLTMTDAEMLKEFKLLTF